MVVNKAIYCNKAITQCPFVLLHHKTIQSFTAIQPIVCQLLTEQGEGHSHSYSIESVYRAFGDMHSRFYCIMSIYCIRVRGIHRAII